MLKIHLRTGTMWLKTIEVEGTKRSDILALIDEYYSEHGDLPVALYSMEDLRQTYEDEEELEQALEEMLPINGGEFYIDGVEYVEEI